MLTPEGQQRIAELVMAAIASVEVSDGADQSARSEPTSREVTDGAIVLRVEFESGFANFDWRERRVLLEDGTALDAEVEDLGRKAEGSVWTLEIAVDIVRLETQAA